MAGHRCLISYWLIPLLPRFQRGESLLWGNLCPCKKLLSNFEIISTTVTFLREDFDLRTKNKSMDNLVRQLRIENRFSRSTAEFVLLKLFYNRIFYIICYFFSFCFISLFYLHITNCNDCITIRWNYNFTLIFYFMYYLIFILLLLKYVIELCK